MIYHLAVLLRGPGPDRSPTPSGCSMAVASAETRSTGPIPSLGRGPRAGARPQPDPAARDVHRRPPDAGVGVSEAARRRPAPAFLLESADQGRVGRYSFIGFRPRKVLRWSLGDPGDPYAIAGRRELTRFRVAEAARACRRSRAAPSACSPTTWSARSSRSGEPNPDPIGVPDLALMMTDALVVFDHLKHTVTVIANVYADDDLEPPTARRARRSPRSAGGCDGPVPRPALPPAANRAAPTFSRTCRGSASRRSWRGSSSTSTPATPSRSCPPSAGRRRLPSRRSRSTAACARSTPAPTCTSWTSATSRSPAPAPSR